MSCQKLALKVVLPDAISALEVEFACTCNIHRGGGCPCVVKAEKFTKTDSGAGYVTTPVGVAMSSVTNVDVNDVFKALQLLHQNKVVHGETRQSYFSEGGV